MSNKLTNFFRLGIFQKILLAMLLVALMPLGVISYIDYRSINENIKDAISSRLAGVSDKLVGHVDDWVMMNQRALEQNATLADVSSMDVQRQGPVLRSMLAGYPWSYLVFTIGPDGMNIGRSDDKPTVDYSDRVYFKQVMQGNPLGQQVVISKTTNKPSLILATPIYAPGSKSTVGAIAMGMSIAELSQQFTSLRIGETGFAFLLDNNGKVVAHRKEEFADKNADFSKHPAFVSRPSGGKTELVYEDEGRTVVASVQTTAQGWTMVTQQAYSEAYAPVRSANIRALAILVITLLAVLIVAYMLSERLSSPIRKLTEIANEMSRGRLFTDIPEANRRDEIGALAAAIDRMGTSIRLAMERLRAKA
jgi:methyl-accepting chemotaxis protein